MDAQKSVWLAPFLISATGLHYTMQDFDVATSIVLSFADF